MSKKIYVNGGIVVKTPYFRAMNAGAYYPAPPKDAETIKPNMIDESGYAYLEISEEHPQSIFNEYYASHEFASYYKGASFLYKNYKNVHNDYIERIKSVTEIIDLEIEAKEHRDILYRMFYMNIITSLETFISDIVITKITSSLESMEAHIKQLTKNEQKVLDQLYNGHWEQKLIEFAMSKAYSNIKTIKQDLRHHFNISITDTKGKIKEHIENRHRIAHKNGRRKNDDYFTPTQEELFDLIKDTDNFAQQIYDKVIQADKTQY